MKVVLFRPHQHIRKTWIERLRKSGYDIKFVHDPERIAGETDIIVIDTAVGRWKDYVQLLEGKGAPIVLLVDNDAKFSEEELASLGAFGMISQEEETDRVFDSFLRTKENELTGQTEAGPQTVFPQYGRSLVLPTEEHGSREPNQARSVHEEKNERKSKTDSTDQMDSATNSTLSQRKAVRQRSADHPSVRMNAIREDHATDPEEFPLQVNKSTNPPTFPVFQESEIWDSPAHEQQISPDRETVACLDDFAAPSVPHPVGHSPLTKYRDLPSIAAVYAAKGGVGKTTFLLHLAALLSKEGCRVCVLDLDLLHGTVASMLQMQPNKTVVDLVRRIDDPKASRACLLPTKTGFSIVAAPLQPGTFRMQREQLLMVVRFLKEETDIVLIDTPTHFDSLIKLALEQSEQLFLVTTDEPASMESLGRIKPLLSSLRPAPELYTVWNRLSEPAPKEQWRDLLPWPVMVELPEDPTVSKAVRSGQWIASSPCSPYRLRIKQLADRWLGVEPEQLHSKRSLFNRLFSNLHMKGGDRLESARSRGSSSH